MWVLAERDLGATPRTKYYLVDLPATASLKALVHLAHQRWAIEQQYQELKDELGLDHFEGRSLPGWQRHVVLTALAYAWLQHERRRRGARLPTLPVAGRSSPRFSHLPALKGLFEQVLRLARELGALRVGRVAVDGSKVKANASKHKAMSYGRMRDKERQLRDEVTQLLAQAEAADAAEDATYGDQRGDELPAELQRRESRLKRIREAKRALEARAQEETMAAGESADAVKPDPKAQYNFTDPESRIMHSPDGFVQAYNVQVAVDELQLIVGQAVTQDTNDKHQLMPMITTIEQQSGATPVQLLADAGYCSDENLAAVADTTIDAFIATRKQKH